MSLVGSFHLNCEMYGMGSMGLAWDLFPHHIYIPPPILTLEHCLYNNKIWGRWGQNVNKLLKLLKNK